MAETGKRGVETEREKERVNGVEGNGGGNAGGTPKFTGATFLSGALVRNLVVA